jgi:predicted  nucleic acid-binding Zn-ribbon protein
MIVEQSLQNLHDRITELESRCKAVTQAIEDGKEARRDLHNRLIRMEHRWQAIRERWLTFD